jgi:hypothetical protein
MFSFSPGQGLVEHVLVDISWDYGWKLCEKKEKVMLDEKKIGKVGKEKEKKRKEKCSIVFIVLKILC